MMQTRFRFFPAVFAAFVLTTTSACAAQVYGRAPAPERRGVDDRAYRVGYDTGLAQGRDDARSGRRFDFDHSREYRDADRGYGGYGSRGEYRQLFRQGFSAGYTEGYRRFDRDRRDDGRDRGGFSRSPAADIGYRDGVAAGRDDARDGDRYDPRRTKQYREGDHDYDSRYGSRDAYKRDYRSAFQQGYERGYQENRQR